MSPSREREPLRRSASKMMEVRNTAKKIRLFVATIVVGAVASAQFVGPSTTAPCYVLPGPMLPAGAVHTTAMLTAGETVGGYKLVGLPDGMGVLGTTASATLFVTHEIGPLSGAVRAHGYPGSFVSRWEIDPTTFAFTSGRDHAQAPTDVSIFNRVALNWAPVSTYFGRLCSADLPDVGAFFHNGVGTTARLFLSGEEAATYRAFAHIVSGPDMNKVFELPHLGQCNFENVLASPHPQQKTVVLCPDDSGGVFAPNGQTSEMYMYVGMKSVAGNDIERAGLVGGTLYGLRVTQGGVVVPNETNLYGVGIGTFSSNAQFEWVNLGDASTYTAPTQQALSTAAGLMRFQRLEDGVWDPRSGYQNDFWFVTPAQMTTQSRLWRLRFNDITTPELGGTISIVLNGTEGYRMLDNLTMDVHGRILMCEDPGVDARIGKIWMYDTVNGTLIEVAAGNPAVFDPLVPGFLTDDDELSGIVPAFDQLGDGWYFLNAQAHYAHPDPEVVKGGQLLAMYVDPTLGRTFATWTTSPAGTGTVALHHRFGTPNAAAFTALSVMRGAYPNGWFFGLDIAFADLIYQANSGEPFLVTLDADGAWSSPTYATSFSGVTFYAVGIDDIYASPPRPSPVFGYTIP